MILLSLLSRLRPTAILVIAILLFFGHDLALSFGMPANPVLNFFGSLFFGPGAFPLASGRLLVIAYPVLPWLGIMLAGFVLLSLNNWYGDPVPWVHQKNGAYTFLSFMNVNKYPPSLLFSLATLGITTLILAAAEGRDNSVTRFLLVYGRVPLSFFVCHIYLIHGLMLVVVTIQGYAWSSLDFSTFKFGRPDHAGLSLGAVYLVWAAIVLAFYPLCRWYGNYKARNKQKTWLRYL